MRFFGTNDLPTDLAKKSFAANLARIMPNGEAPLFAMSGLAKKKTALQIEHGYWSKTMVFATVTLGGSGITTDSQTNIPVVSTLSSSVNDIVRIPSAFSGGFVAPENMRVTAIVDATNLTVERGFAGTTAKSTVAAGTVLPHVGNAYAEGSPKPLSKAIVPVRNLNNTHIFRNAWSQSKTLAAVQMIVGNGTVAENRMDASNFHGRDIELATFFSRKSNTIDPITGEPLHTMDGIEALIEILAPQNLVEAGATTNYDQLITLVDPIFDQKTDRMRGNSRVIYAGSTAINVFNAIGRLSGEYRIVQRQNNFGLKFTEFTVPRGTFQLIEHPIFNTDPEWKKMAVIADLSSFDFAHLEGRDTEVTFINENKASTDGADSTGGVLTTELTIEMQNPFAWGIIYNMRAGAA